jgi:hypothetical protein
MRMADLSGYPYFEVHFDKDGKVSRGANLSIPSSVRDLFIISHGWRNNEEDACTLYRGLFNSFRTVSEAFNADPSRIGVLGVFWPSEAFDESLASVAAAQRAVGNAAGRDATGTAIQNRLDQMKVFFDDPSQWEKLEAAKGKVRALETTAGREAFVGTIRSLFEQPKTHPEDASDDFFERDADELMRDLRLADEDEPAALSSPGETGGAAGLQDAFNSFKAAALRVLNYATYFEMKRRSGNVGRSGLASLIDRLAGNSDLGRIHLIGHSFGGRVVTSAAANANTPKLKSMTLLQAAFSHNGFSQMMHGFFRNVVDQKKVSGPVLITYSEFDRANGIAYPIASRLSQDKTQGFGDKTDVFGAIGRNGAQKMAENEVVEGDLLAVDKRYDFSAPKLYNLNGAAFIKDHGMVTGKEIAYALLSALFAHK